MNYRVSIFLQLGKEISRAMCILGFPPTKIFEKTSEDEIGKAFISRMKRVFKKRNQKLNQKENEDEEWQNQVIILNGALQVLKKKKECSTKARQNWKGQAQQTNLMNKVVGAFQDGSKTKMTKDESKMAHEIAREIVAGFEEKSKKQNR